MMANNRIPSGPNTPGSQQTPTHQGIKIFIQRDYSEGTAVKFQTRFPPELEDRVSESQLLKLCLRTLGHGRVRRLSECDF